MFVFGGSGGESLWLNDLSYLDLGMINALSNVHVLQCILYMYSLGIHVHVIDQPLQYTCMINQPLH